MRGRSLGQREQGVAAVERRLVALRRRRRRGEDDDRSAEPRANHGEVPRVVPETLLLLVSRLVLLVDDYEPERAHRREDGRARADDDARLAPDDARPLRPALAWTEAAVEDRCAVAEATPHALDELVSERDLRDEHDDVALGGERGLGSGEEHLGLPAPGDAVEEEGPRLAGRHGGRDRVGRRALRGGERRPRRWRRRLRVAHIDPRAYVDRDDAGADEPVE